MLNLSANPRWIQTVIVDEAVLLVALVAGTFFFLLWRGVWVAFRKRTEERLADLLVKNLFAGDAQADGGLPAIPLKLWQRQIYRDIILNSLHEIEGAERLLLIRHYFQQGYFAHDLDLLESRAWWRRLSAIIRLDVLSVEPCREPFVNALGDEHPLVRLGAARALSRLGGSKNTALVLATLDRVGIFRLDAQVEILHNICVNVGPAPICERLLKTKDDRTALACVKALGQLRAPEATPVFENLLVNTHSEPLIEAVLEGLRQIGDPECAPTVARFLQHAQAAIRAQALLTLFTIHSEEAYARLPGLREGDLSFEVQSVISAIERRAA